MSKREIDKTAICELSKLFAKKTGACGARLSMDCATCAFDGDCLSLEIAKQVYAMGYIRTDHVNNDTQTIETIAKDIAFVRGYGCGEQDSCSKCTCASILGCIPLQLANCMIAAGYKKKEG